MQFQLSISSDDQACTDDPVGEVVQALRVLADKLELGRPGNTIMDSNGNTIGSWVLYYQKPGAPFPPGS